MELKEIFLESVPSTNEWLKERLDEFPPTSLICVRANQQTRGRGQRSNQWHSPPDVNLYLSFCMQAPEEKLDPLLLTHILALTVAHSLQKKGLSPAFKWPNDLLVHKKKISGILCETLKRNELRCCILGLGLNVNLTENEQPFISQPATSIFIETGEKEDLELFYREFLTLFKKNSEIFLERGSAPFETEIRELMSPCQVPRES